MRKPGKRCKETDAHYYWNSSDVRDRYFFKVLTGDFHERLVSFQVQCVSCKFFFWGFSLTRVCLLRSGIFFFCNSIFLLWPFAAATSARVQEKHGTERLGFLVFKKNCAFCIWLVIDANLTRLGTWCCAVKVGDKALTYPYYCTSVVKLFLLEYCWVN